MQEEKNFKLFIETLKFKNDKTLISSIVTGRFFSSIYGVDLLSFITNQTIMIESQHYVFNKFPDVFFIPGIWPDFGSGIILPSFIGAKISWYKNSSPVVSRPVINNLKEDINYIKNINVLENGFGPWYFKILDKFVSDKRFKNNTHFAWSSGPGELAGYLLGLENFLIGMAQDALNIKKLLTLCTEVIMDFLSNQFYINKSAEGFLLTDDISGLISNDFYKEFLLPFHIKIRNKFNEKIFVFHNDTKSDHIIDSLISAGIDVFNFGPATNLDLLIEKMLIPKKVVLLGNIDPTKVLLSNDKELIRRTTKDLLYKIEKYPGFIIAAGGGLNAMDPEDFKVFVEEVKNFNDL